MIPLRATKVSGGFTMVYLAILVIVSSDTEPINAAMMIYTLTQVLAAVRGPIVALLIFKRSQP